MKSMCESADKRTGDAAGSAERASAGSLRARRPAASSRVDANASSAACAPSSSDEITPAAAAAPVRGATNAGSSADIARSRTGIGGVRDIFRELRRWKAPVAFRTRLRVALILVFAFAAARIWNGKPLELGWLFDSHVYASSSDSRVQAFVQMPPFGFVLLMALARFMLTRPQPPPRPRERMRGLADVLEARGDGA